MTVLTVGPQAQYKTISAAVTASQTGDTINVQAGTYTNDFITINHSLDLAAVGGTVNLVATTSPPNGKALIDEGGSGVAVRINGFDISGVKVADNNGAAIRYEGGALYLENDTIHNNQEGLLGAADPNGTITINASNFNSNGAGDGYTHNIYAGNIANLTVQNSTITGAVVGHEIKSRAQATTITGNTISDGSNGTASYEIDLPNGGAVNIANNYIQKGANAQNPIGISFGEEGNLHANSSLSITRNTLVNDSGSASSTAIVNASNAAATVSNNSFYGWNTQIRGPATVTGNTTPATRPTSATDPAGTSTTPVTPVAPIPPSAPVPPAPAPASPDALILSVSEDAWSGDAQFRVSVNGVDVGSTFTATASHSAGASQQIAISGNWGANVQSISATFINDAYGGSAATDRNLYVNGVNYDGHDIAGSSAALYSNGTKTFSLVAPVPPAAPVTPAVPTVTAPPAVPVTPPSTSPDKLVLSVSEDAWNGDAQFKVSVNGVDVGSTFTATAAHNAGASQQITISGNWGANPQNVSATFINDAYGGTAATDRNLYVNNVNYDGHDIAGSSASLLSNGTKTFNLAAPAPTFIALHLAEDAYLGDAQYSVAIDGKQAAPNGVVTASHAVGASMEVDISSALTSGKHDLALSFLNDAYGGSAATDRNLYSTGIEVNGTAVAGAAFPLYSATTQHVSFYVP